VSRVGPWRQLATLFRLTLAAALLAWLGRAVLSLDAKQPDFICYWTAGKLLASGRSPYDVDLQTRVQREYGWDKETTGKGTFEFLPYYYPPWFGSLFVALLPLGYDWARFAWFFVNIELALLTGYLLRQNMPGIPRWVPLLLVPVFLFSVACVVLGQTALLVFFLAALAWRLLEQHRDRSAGVVLAWWTIKPQLTVVLLVGVLLWLARQRRWNALGAFAVTVAVLCLGSTLLVPSWPVQMWQAPRQTPSPTEYYPWIGNAWFLVLRAVGLRGWPLALLYLAVALPFAAGVLRLAFDRGAPLSALLVWGILAAFFVAPYARHYDFPVLLIPALLLVEQRLPRLGGLALAVALAVLPYVQFSLLTEYQRQYEPSARFFREWTFFWVPLLLTALWVLPVKRLDRSGAPGQAGQGA
jgi:hypothetical protein